MGAVLLADTEGTGTAGATVDAQIFTLPLLLSSAAIFSTTARGAAERANVLEELASIVSMAKTLNFGGGGGGGDTIQEAPTFGHLHVVFRDYNLEGRDPEVHKEKLFGSLMNPRALRADNVPEEAAKALLATKAYLNSMFKSITVHIFPNPTVPAVDPEFTFKKATAKLWEKIRTQLQEGAMKMSGDGLALTGSTGSGAMALIGQAINSRGSVDVPSLAETILVAEGVEVMDAFASRLLQHNFVEPPPSAEALAAGGEKAFDDMQRALGVTWDKLKPVVEAKLGAHVMPSVLEEVKTAFDVAVQAHRATVVSAFSRLQAEAERKAAMAEVSAAQERIKVTQKELDEAKITSEAAQKATAEANKQKEASEARAAEAVRRAEEAQKDAERARSESKSGAFGIEQLITLIAMMGMGRGSGGGDGGGGGMPMGPMGGGGAQMGSPGGGGGGGGGGGEPRASRLFSPKTAQRWRPLEHGGLRRDGMPDRRVRRK